MSKRILIFFLSFGLFFGALARSEDQIDQARFTQLYDMYQRNGVRPPAPERHAAEDIHYVLVSGFWGDLPGDYFTFQHDELIRLGIPESRIHIIKPNSRRPIDENTGWLYRKLQKIPGKLVVIAHSKGAAESVATAMKHPDFVEQKIEGIYCIQGAFGGSPLATAITRIGPLEFPTDHLSAGRRWLLSGTRSLAGLLIYPLFKHGLISLSREPATKYWADLMDKHRDSIPIVSPRVHYIVTKTQKSQLSRLLEPFYGPNDGVLAVDAQQVKGLGSVVAEVSAEHEALVTNYASREVANPHRYSIARTIFAAVETRFRALASLHCPWVSLAAAAQ